MSLADGSYPEGPGDGDTARGLEESLAGVEPEGMPPAWELSLARVMASGIDSQRTSPTGVSASLVARYIDLVNSWDLNSDDEEDEFSEFE